ncbi:PilC/PilY family type IV pilus protein [bacterium]|nr:PilC/PilY family type IV pilus protein [bacterium]
MKFLFLIKILFLFLIFNNSVFAKGLPPGTGSNDVPANVLILLDKSGSMNTPISTGGITKPQAVAVDSATRNSYVGMSSSIVRVKYDDMSVDTTWTFNNSGTCEMGDIKELRVHGNFLYVLDYSKDRLFRLTLTGGPATCDWSVAINNPISMDIKNDILYATGNEILVFDLSNATPSSINCSYSGDLLDDGKNAKSLAIDSSGSNLYFHRSGNLKRYEIQGDNCPAQSRSNSINTSGVNTNHGFIFKPGSDTEIYMPDYNDQFYKFTLNTAKNGMASSVQASAGYSGNVASTTSPNRINIDWPYAIDVDTANNQLHFVSRGCCKHSMHVIDFDMQFIKESGGGQNETRMTGAVEAIQEVVGDSSLNSHVSFGFGVWSESGASFTGWSGDITTGSPIPDHDKNSLKVRVHTEGAGRINTVAPTIVANGGTTFSKSFADLAEDYYLGALSPIDPNLDCQNTHIVVIGDGAFSDSITDALNIISGLNNTHDIKTHIVAYGGGITGSALEKFEQFAVAGGTENVIIANTPTSLKTQLSAKISQIVASNFAFTSPSIPPNKNESTNAVFQSSFTHKSKQSWRGKLIRTAIDENGNLIDNDPGNWDAKDVLPNPADRKIWSIIPNTDYRTDYNNFVDTNADEIASIFRIFNFEVQDYHSENGSPDETQRCHGIAQGVEDGNDDDLKGIINFLRGQDYFDYNGNCNLTEARLDNQLNKSYLGDFYHSELLVVGPPSANTSFTNQNQEAYWRSIKGYDVFAEDNKNREEIIYVGGNDGMLHAFNSASGIEEWGFIPPLLAGTIPKMVDKAFNKNAGGGTVAIYGVDGSPIVHDMFFEGPFDNAKVWHTILMVPYGRGGKGFSILDVTDPDAPLHLFSVFNDSIRKIVHIINHLGVHDQHQYVGHSYPINALKESITATTAANADPPTGAEICDNSGNNHCFQSNVWTLQTNPQVPGLTKDDFKVFKDEALYDDFNINYDGAGDIVFTFGDTMRFLTYDDPNLSTSELLITFEAGSAGLGVQSKPGYDYSRLGETWSQPRILRIPNDGAGDNDIEDDIYAAVLGGGFDKINPQVGSNLFIINLEVDPADRLFAKIEEQIQIVDLDNAIPNSTPALPVVITSDEVTTNFTGGLVYLNDIEGKITKFNLTNMSTDNQGNDIEMYDSTTLFSVGATKTNGRYMYQSMDAGFNKGSNDLWMYVGTGNFTRLTDKSDDIDNVLLGIKDVDFPYYRNVNDAINAADLTNCSDTTNDDDGDNCPGESQLGWRIHLDNSEKSTAEPTLTRGRVLFPIFQPTLSVNSCSTGLALLCNIHAKCGTPKNKEIGSATDLECLEVGTGVLSKVVVFGNKLFANIAGTAKTGAFQGSRDDLVSINSGAVEIESLRNSWRENY